MKNFLETKNLLTKLIQGRFVDAFARLILNILKAPERWEVVNRQNNAFTTQIMSCVLTKHSKCIEVGCNAGDF